MSIQERVPRRDARDNRERLLLAASEVFDDQGAEASILVIARRAAVGVGTVYRNFATKRALFDAVVLADIESLLGAAASCADEAGCASDALFRFLGHIVEATRDRAAIRDAIWSEGEMGRELHAAVRALEDALAGLLWTAQRAGEIRPALAARDVLALLGAIQTGRGSDERAARCSLLAQVVCEGLRQPASRDGQR